MLLERNFYTWEMRETGHALVSVGLLLAAWLGHVEEALQEATRARDVFLRLGEYYWVCVIDNNAAMIYDHIGRYQDALKLYENILGDFSYPDRSKTKPQIKRSIAIAQLNQADLPVVAWKI